MPEPKKMNTFNSTGDKPGPGRAALLAQAREHLKDPWVKYIMVNIHGILDEDTNSNDFRDHVLVGRSRAEVLVAYYDFLNEFCPTTSGCDFYPGVDEVDGLDWLFDPIGNDNVWLRPIPDMPNLHYVRDLKED